MVSEWRHVVDRFNHFVTALRPTDGDVQAMRGAATTAARHLSGQIFGMPPDLRDTLRDFSIIGGFAKGTAINQAPCIDTLFLLPDHLRGKAGPELFQGFVGSLARRFPIHRVTPEGWVTVEVDAKPWQGGAPAPVLVQVIPCFPCGVDGFLVWDSSKEREWRHIHPDAEAAALAKANLATENKATHLIMMLKAWRNANAVPMSGFALELMVCDFVQIWTYHRRSLLFYDWMLRDFFFWLRHQDARDLRIPGTIETVKIGQNWRWFARNAHEVSLQACELERDNKILEAGALWRSLFGDAVVGGDVVEPPRSRNPKRLAQAS